jgi:hypothetical protein
MMVHFNGELSEEYRPRKEDGPPFSIGCNPGDGCSMQAEFRISGNGHWYAWPLGEVAEPSIDEFGGGLDAIRFRRVSGNAACNGEIRTPGKA